MIIIDFAQRKAALNPYENCIVQAPAGSGKTELLTQRYLTLLTQIESPEEILAITFTQKAAAEMRQRIVESLQHAAEQSQPSEEPKKSNWALAQAVLKKDQQQGWGLLANANRLRIMTIDSLCAQLVRQMPLLSGVGGSPAISDMPSLLYNIAAERTLNGLHTKQSWSPALAILLEQLDNQWDKAQALIAKLLAKRDQWLEHVVPYRQQPDSLKQHLESVLQLLAEDAVQAVWQSWQTLRQKYPALNELPAIAQRAANYLAQDNKIMPVSIWLERSVPPHANLEDLPFWQAWANFLTTENNNQRTWRSPLGLNKTFGFPAASGTKDKAEKEAFSYHKALMQHVLEDLQQETVWLNQLDAVLACPPLHYRADHWQLLTALLEILPIAVAQLTVAFEEYGQVDFCELSLRALQALNSADAPTELQLKLDYQIQHLLVDEFQDTSVTHLKLLTLLVEGWQVGDGRTVFLVGDPMQSIYRFREADVSLFLRAQQQGLAHLPLEVITLSANFRAQPALLEWVNKTFSQIFPVQSDLITGAVSYSDSHPGRVESQKIKQSPVQFYPCLTAENQHQKIVECVKQHRNETPNDSLVILVRARSHIQSVMQRLQQEEIPVQAVEIESLQARPFIQDLMSLTRALFCLEDKIAWLAFLRSPWCGLALADIYVLASEEGVLWQRMLDAVEKKIALSTDGLQRLIRCCEVLAVALAQRRRLSVAETVEQTWLALGGLSCIYAHQVKEVQLFFRLLDKLDQANDLIDLDRLEEKLAQLYGESPESIGPAVQIMTIHKAKGLEFDHVILPYLEKTNPSDEKELLMWWRHVHPKVGELLCLAPIHNAYDKEEGIYHFLRKLQREQMDQERIRLLYVAATRARQQLDLVACVELSEKEDAELKWLQPKSGSFLKLLWPVLEKEHWPTELPFSVKQNDVAEALSSSAHLYRFPNDWQNPLLALQMVGAGPSACPEENGNYRGLPLQNEIETDKNRAPVDEDPSGLRATGQVLHRMLEGFSRFGVPELFVDQIKNYRVGWQRLLVQQGVLTAELTHALMLLEKAVSEMLQDPRGKWLLTDHLHAVSEYEITCVAGKKVQRLVIDRSFVADNIRWIVDYKLIEADLEQAWLLYAAQLQRYAKVMHDIQQQRGENYPIHIALYLPLVRGWKMQVWSP